MYGHVRRADRSRQGSRSDGFFVSASSNSHKLSDFQCTCAGSPVTEAKQSGAVLRYDPRVLNTRICAQCEDRLTEAEEAMGHHSTVMREAIYIAKSGEPTQEQRTEYTARLRQSLEQVR